MHKTLYYFFCSIVLWLLLLALQGCSTANYLRLMHANSSAEFNWNNAGDINPIKASYEGEKLYLWASINGVEGFKLLVDTGASFTILMDTEKVKRLGLKPGYDLMLGGWGQGKDSQAYQTSLQSLTLGKMQVQDIDVAYIPTSTSEYYSRQDEVIVDGVLGHDLLSKLTWHFDRKQHQAWASRQVYQAKDGELRLPFDTFLSKISVDVDVDFGNGQVATEQVIIDTGSRHYFKLGSAYIDGQDIVLPKGHVTAADFGLSGKVEHKRVTLPGISLGGYRLNKVKTNIIPSDDEDEWWVLGNALLSQFAITLDYANENMYLRPYAEHTFHSRYNLLGLELRKLQSGNFVLRYVFPGLAGEQAGLKVGDEIISINGKAAKDISMLEWLKLSDTQGQYKVCRLQASCVNLSSTRVEGYSM